MTFYMKPPRGFLSLHTVEKCVFERFEYLQALLDNEEDAYTPTNFEYLIEGTAMDRASHYLLRLISLSSFQFKVFLIKAETKFFLQRTNFLNVSKQVTGVLRLLRRHAEECSKEPPISEKFSQFLFSVIYICNKMTIKSVADHAFSAEHSKTCDKFNLTLPFTICLPMVRARQVELHMGNATIPCGIWKDILIMFFKMHLKLGIAHLENTRSFQDATNDPRINDLIERLGSNFKAKHRSKCTNELRRADLKDESVYFPPCMSQLWYALQSKRRLPHEARRHFTLFLKDAGMMLEESINFWSEMYSQPHQCGGCTHSWQKDSKRYIYSIRHMYGLEGGRYNYRVPSCSQIQGMTLKSAAEGGCPFQYLEDSKLKARLPLEIQEDESVCNEILRLKAEKEPTKACHMYLQACRQLHTESPAQRKVEDSREKTEAIIRFRFYNPFGYYITFKSELTNSLGQSDS